MWAFVMVMGWSRAIYVECVRAADVATFIRCHLNAFHLYVEIAPQIGQSVGWARGARRSPLGEQGLLLDCTVK